MSSRLNYWICVVMYGWCGCNSTSWAQHIEHGSEGWKAKSQTELGNTGKVSTDIPYQANESIAVPPVDCLLLESQAWTREPNLPLLSTAAGTIAYFPAAYAWGGYDLWELHGGFNAQLHMSVTGSFGRNRFPGVGFGTGVSAMYARRLTEKLTVAAGGYYNRLSWNGFHDNRVGLTVLAGYQLTEKISVYAFGSKSLIPSASRRMLFPMPYMNDFNTRLGGMLHVKLSDAVSVSVGVEERRR